LKNSLAFSFCYTVTFYSEVNYYICLLRHFF